MKNVQQQLAFDFKSDFLDDNKQQSLPAEDARTLFDSRMPQNEADIFFLAWIRFLLKMLAAKF